MVQVDGRKIVDGSMSYVAQQAWIQNMTVQDNILFGKNLNTKMYEDVLTASALRNGKIINDFILWLVSSTNYTVGSIKKAKI